MGLTSCRGCGRGLISLYCGLGLGCTEIGSSIDCMIDFGRICATGEMIRRTTVGSNLSDEYRDENLASFWSSVNKSAIRCSSLLI